MTKKPKARISKSVSIPLGEEVEKAITIIAAYAFVMLPQEERDDPRMRLRYNSRIPVAKCVEMALSDWVDSINDGKTESRETIMRWYLGYERASAEMEERRYWRSISLDRHYHKAVQGIFTDEGRNRMVDIIYRHLVQMRRGGIISVKGLEAKRAEASPNSRLIMVMSIIRMAEKLAPEYGWALNVDG